MWGVKGLNAESVDYYHRLTQWLIDSFFLLLSKVLNAKSVVGSSVKDCCVMNKAEAAAKKAGGDAQTKETEAAPEPKVR